MRARAPGITTALLAVAALCASCARARQIGYERVEQPTAVDAPASAAAGPSGSASARSSVRTNDPWPLVAAVTVLTSLALATIVVVVYLLLARKVEQHSYLREKPIYVLRERIRAARRAAGGAVPRPPAQPEQNPDARSPH